MSDPIRDIRTPLINHDDPIVRQAYEYIVDLELAHAKQRDDHTAEVEQFEEERSGLQYTVKGLIAANRQMADRIKYLEADVERLRDYDDRLTAVMLPDYKDWHENAKSEWPEVAAATISSLREQADFFREAFDRTDARVTELEAAAESARGYLAWLGRHGDENADARADTLYAVLAAGKGDEHE